MESRISAHESVKAMQEKLKKDGMTTVWDRWAAQEQVRCKSFCAKGLSCQFCSNGPCRIIPGKLERGTCGMDGDGMAIRYMLLRNAMGLSTYTYHAREVALTLIATGEGKTPYGIRDEGKLRLLAGALGLDESGPAQKLAVEVGREMLAEINSSPRQGLKIIPKFATQGRVNLWKRLGIFPGGPANEQIDAISHCLTNVDGDYASLAKTALRLSLSCIYGSLIPLEYGQDILFGTPRPHPMNFDLALLDPAYVNIVVNGHEPFVGLALIKHCSDPNVQEEAVKVGAKGIRVIGSIETGQEILQRVEMSPVFVGMTGNWLSIEPLIATEDVDLFAMDMNCCPPSLEDYARKYPTTFVSVSPLVNIPGVEKHMDYSPEEVSGQAARLALMAIENFRARKGRGLAIHQPMQSAVVGFSTESILEELGGTLTLLLDAVKTGKIKGIVALVSCTTLGNGPQDLPTITMAKELIKKDILVLSMGCGNAAVQLGGLCTNEAKELAGEGLRSTCTALGIPPVLSFGTCSDTGRVSVLVSAIADALGVDVPDLPIAITAPQYMEQKATIDAVFALAFGTFTHVSPTPPLVGGERLMKLLGVGLEGLTGGKIYLENDMAKAAEAIEGHILKKRAALGIGRTHS